MGDTTYKQGGDSDVSSIQGNLGSQETSPKAGVASGLDFGTFAQHSPGAGAEVAAAVGIAGLGQSNTSTISSTGGDAGGDLDIKNSGNVQQ